MANLMLTLKADQKAAVHTTPNGLLDSPIAPVSSNPAVASIEPVPNPADFWLLAQAPGSCTVTIGASAGGNNVSDVINVTVQPAWATSLGTVIESPVSK